jgi:hypothetical protein
MGGKVRACLGGAEESLRPCLVLAVLVWVTLVHSPAPTQFKACTLEQKLKG